MSRFGVHCTRKGFRMLDFLVKKLKLPLQVLDNCLAVPQSLIDFSLQFSHLILHLFIRFCKDDDGFGSDRSMNFWNFGRDILRDILGHNSLPWDHTLACHHSCIFVKLGCLFDHLASF
ncbi:hypothetical protein Tco_0421840 [Tanacetum coccineum]